MNALRRRHPPGQPYRRVRGDIEFSHRWTTRKDGTRLRLLIVRPAVPRQGVPGVLWIHGGGYAIGTPEQFRTTAKRLVTASNAVVVMPDYGCRPRRPSPLLWTTAMTRWVALRSQRRDWRG